VTLSQLESRLRDRLAQPLPGGEAHRRFAPRPPRKSWQPGVIPDSARRAAALILLYPGAAGPSFCLTERRSDLPHHPGQISLPGGRLDPGETASAAALREAHEEVGVAADRVRLLGALSPLFVVVSNFAIEPFVGIADARPDFRIAAREVETLIEVPLTDLHTDRLHWGQKQRDDVTVDFPYFDLSGHQVWGATAMILGEFAILLRDHGSHGVVKKVE
jgi:8-oxo-dGTP pyrophosphatase MutT (NUDIX family)